MVKVAVGCGKRNYGPEWLHIDGDVLKFDHMHSSDVYLRDFESNSVDLIYACHLINYFDRNEVGELFNFWFDKLKPGGVLRIATPDIRVMAELLTYGKVKVADIIGPIHGLWICNMATIVHETSWDLWELKDKLYSHGFANVKEYDWRKTEHADIDDHSQSYLDPKGNKEIGTLISLNIECMKIV